MSTTKAPSNEVTSTMPTSSSSQNADFGHKNEVPSEREASTGNKAPKPHDPDYCVPRLANPLHGIEKPQLFEQVTDFANKYGLTEALPLLKKGALVAQRPHAWDAIEELDENDKEHLRREISHRWSHPRMLYFLIVLSSIGAAVQGWDQTGSNGANLSWPLAFGIPDSGSTCTNAGTCEKNSWLIGFVNGCPYMAIAVFTAWLSEPINNLLGRRITIFIGAIFAVLAPLGSAFTQSWPQLVVCRILLGIGMGLKEVTVPLFSAEAAPTNIRGGLVMSWQTWVAFGILLGTSANLAVVNVMPAKIVWRLQLGAAFLPAVPLVLGIFLVPESPRWLISKGRYDAAYRSLCKLRNSGLQAARDLYHIHAHAEQEKRIVEVSGFSNSNNFITRVVEIFTIPRLRRANQAASVVMMSQIFCGINIIAFYSSTIFVNAGATNIGALLASWGFGIVNFIFAWPAVWTIDTFGRRALLLFTFPNMFWTLLAAGMSFYIHHATTRVGLVALFIYLFDVFYSPGAGPVPFTYSAEVWPITHRDIGMCWSIAWINLWASVLGLTFPRILLAFTTQGAFGFFAGLNIFMFVLIYFFVPETKQRSLEEMDYLFAVPTRSFISFEVRKTTPWFFKRYITRSTKEEKPELLHFQKEHLGNLSVPLDSKIEYTYTERV